ncbi:unnamed protein product [Caenorhabditis auriculariae]|uniref:Ubiquitin-like domain-containing protein n=1 Tax=Caenorhabditis auriculariae TaxID=2777116 RepID=A0A8S1GX52_9PELO|nr:unnamed protein product [Caenorhabditis auriculariae]
MDLCLVLNLEDQDGVSHRKKPSKFNKETSIEQLSKAIYSVWNIDEKKYQELFFNGHQILSLNSTLQQIGVKNDDEIVVPERTKFAHQAIACSKALEDSGFLIVYASFGPQWRDTISPMMRFVDRTQSALKQSATTFFSQKYPNAKIDFKSKQGGSRAGIVVIVTCNGEETTYYMKNYHHAGSSMSLQKYIKATSPGSS